MPTHTVNYDERILFYPDIQVMEVDFSNITFDVSQPVNAFYDEVDRRIEATDQKWYFLVNYLNCKIMAEAWITFHHRGKKVNLAYSLGSVRYAASEVTGSEILERSQQENFDPNLFTTREAALAYLQEMRRQIPADQFQSMLKPDLPPPGMPLEERIIFHPDIDVMEVDFSDLVFEGSQDVNAIYNVVDWKIEETGRDWYFMVDYRNCEILPDAWITFASRGKKVNLAHSLGTVRFGTTPQTGDEILEKSRSDDFDPNLLATRDEALARIEEMKRENPSR